MEVRLCEGRPEVLAADTFPESELEQYLAGCRGREFIICCNPSLFHQHMLHLPPAALRHYQALVASEIAKLHPEPGPFTSWHRVTGQAIIDGKVFNKVATFSYPTPAFSSLLEAFSRQGREVRHLYPAPYPIFRLAASTSPAEPERARLYLAPLPGEKLLLVAENGELQFVRKIPSEQPALSPEDVPKIRMTLDYCAQSLRVNATEAVLLRTPRDAEPPPPPLALPLRQQAPRVLAQLPDELRGYLAPLAAALHYFQAPKLGDILPPEYRALARKRKLLSRGGRTLTALALLAAGCALMQFLIIGELKPELARVRAQLGSAQRELAHYRTLDQEVRTLKRRVTPAHSYNPALVLASLSRLSSRDFAVKAIAAQNEPSAMKVRIDGAIDATGYGAAQSTFEGIVRQVGALPGFTVTSSRMDMTLKTFDLEARYSEADPGAR